MAAKTAPKVTAAGVAKLRREGATWQEVRDNYGVKTSSGAFTTLLNEEGFDAAGLKGGKGSSKARVRGSSNGSGSKATAKKAVKATGKTKTTGKAKVTRKVTRSGKGK